MTEWKKVTGTQPEQPAEVDTTSSPTTVYLRRNVKQITQTDENGESVQMWEYEEQTMTKSEYLSMHMSDARLSAIEDALCELDSMLSEGEKINE